MTNWNFINGWSLRNTRVNCAVILGLMMTMFNQPTYAGNEEIPSMEFLEFLGSGVSVEGEFLDPVNYTEIETESSVETQTGKDKTQNDDE